MWGTVGGPTWKAGPMAGPDQDRRRLRSSGKSEGQGNKGAWSGDLCDECAGKAGCSTSTEFECKLVAHHECVGARQVWDRLAEGHRRDLDRLKGHRSEIKWAVIERLVGGVIEIGRPKRRADAIEHGAFGSTSQRACEGSAIEDGVARKIDVEVGVNDVEHRFGAEIGDRDGAVERLIALVDSGTCVVVDDHLPFNGVGGFISQRCSIKVVVATNIGSSQDGAGDSAVDLSIDVEIRTITRGSHCCRRQRVLRRRRKKILQTNGETFPLPSSSLLCQPGGHWPKRTLGDPL